ncbi:uncharacterized protein crybg2 isoform X2 [Paramisgurnus dabryanus]|uniref:uncharacterized protein crybg2 isoform X2 n=1 Tax=Paramisgurnus dabryanus TaxID=90735 RepID=UPI0031F468FC
MAKKSISAKKSFKSLFSKSEANLKDCVEDDSSRSSTLKLFKWKKKKKNSTDIPEDNLTLARTEPATLGGSDSQDGEEFSGHKPSVFGTGPRKKKALLSYSETDLRKPRSFSTFTFRWKKKKRDSTTSLSDIIESPLFKGPNSEQGEFEDQVEKEQTSPQQVAVETTPAYTIPEQSQTQDVWNDVSWPSKEDRPKDAVLVTEAYMPTNQDGELIPYIDSSFSDSDSYQTPPQSPTTHSRSDSPTQAVTTEYQIPRKTYIPNIPDRFSQMNAPDPVNVTSTLNTADVLSSYYDAVEERPGTKDASLTATAVHRSSQFSNTWSSIPEEDFIDSISLDPYVNTAARYDTYSVDNSRPEEHPKPSHSLPNSDFETPESETLTNIENQTKQDIAPEEDKDLTFTLPAVHRSSQYSNTWSSIPEEDFIDSISLVPYVNTAARYDTYSVDNSRPEEHPKLSHSLPNSDFETPESETLTNIENKTKQDIAPEEDKDLTFTLPSVNRSSQYSNTWSSTPEDDFIDSISLVPNMNTFARYNTYSVDNAWPEEHLNQNSTSDRDDHSLHNSDFETLTNIENQTKQEMLAPNADTMISQESKDSTFAVSENFTSFIHLSSSLNSNNTTYQSSTPKPYSDFIHPEQSPSNPTWIITTEAEDPQTSTYVSDTCLYKVDSNTDPCNVTTDTIIPNSLMPDVDADIDIKPISSFFSSDVSLAEANLRPVHEDLFEKSFPTTTNFLHHVTISVESPQTDSEEPCPAVVGPVHLNAEPVLLENESKISLAQSVISGIHTPDFTKTDTFDLSDSITFDPEPSLGVLHDSVSYSCAVNRSEKQDLISKEIDQAYSASYENYSITTSSDLTDHDISRTLISETEPTVSIHPPSHSQLLSSLARKEEIFQRTIKPYGGLNAGEGLYKDSFETIGQDETSEKCMTTVDDLQMFVKEEEHIPDIYNESHKVTPIEVKENNTEQIQSDLPKYQMILPNIVKVEEMPQSLLNTTETSITQGVIALEPEVCADTNVLTGQAERQIHCFALLKPVLPVNQDYIPKECVPAPPSSESVKVSLAESSMATHSHLETWLRPLSQYYSGGVKTIPEDTARIKYQTSADIQHAERQEHTNNEDIGTSLTSTQVGQEPNSEEETDWPDKYNTEETFIHTRSASFNQGEVRLTEVNTDNITTFTQRNVVDSSKTTPEGWREVEDLHRAEVNAVQEHLLPTRLIPGDRFFHASTDLSTVIEEPDIESEEETEPVSDTNMSTGIAVLNTKLSRRSSSTQEGREDVKVARKVSLVSTDSKSSYESSFDNNGLRDWSEPSTASPEFHRRWQGIHSDSEVKHFKSFMENSDYNLTHGSSPSYEKVLYTSHFGSPGTQKTQPTYFSSESTGSLGNSSWKVTESEVQQGSESYLSGRSGVELNTPVGGREADIQKTGFDSQARLENSLRITEEEEDSFSGVFHATRVELVPSPTSLEPEPLIYSSSSEMDSLVDTLKSMDRPVRQRLQRTSSNTPFSSLPPIEEDAPILSPPEVVPVTEPKKVMNGVSSLPPDFGMSWSSNKDMRSPLTLLKEQQFGENRGPALPMRASALNSIVMRRGSLNDLSTEETPSTGLTNGSSMLNTSRLENSLFFQPTENGKGSHRSIFRAASLPDIGSSHERISSAPKSTDTPPASRYERFSYLRSSSSSLSGISETPRISMPPSIQQNSPTEATSFNHKNSLELYRSLPSETLFKNSPSLGLQRSVSVDGGLHLNNHFNNNLNNDNKGFQMNHKPKPEPERNLAPKYRAFPDSYLTKQKEHGKLNPRPGKMLIFDQPELTGQRIEVRGDVVDATPWEFTGTISIRVVRGGWVLYEQPNFKGERIALDEGDTELTNPFGPLDEEEDHRPNGIVQNQGDEENESKPRLKKKFVIGSIRRAVRDYSVPEICLFPEENAEGKKVTFRDTSDDARIYGYPVKANSVIVNAGLWLVFAEPFFQGNPRVLEVGGFPTPAAWGVTQPYVSSLHPLKIGEPRVENLFEPKIVLYEKPYFTGKSREVYSSMRDFMTRTENRQSLFMYSPGSIKVVGGCWVGYEKEGFRGHQYLLEEGEYHDWRVWGGVNSELRSLRVIQADLSEPMLVLYGEPEGEKVTEEEPTFEVTEAVPDVELFGFGINTRSIHVLNGAWVAYSHVDFSGNQYVLEKGFYRGCGDWGSVDNHICSIQPILPVLLYSEPSFQGTCSVCNQNMDRLPDKLTVKSCRVVGGSWVLYEGDGFTGDMFVLSEGNYPNLTSMGCPPSCCIRSVRSVPVTLSVPSVSLFGLECFEGREVTVESELSSLQEESFNTHFLSVRVNSGCWVLCEHSNYRGRQFLLEPIEIPNWHKFSSLSSVGSLYPIRQKRTPFRIRNKESGHYMSVQGGVEDMKTGRVVVTEEVEGMSDVWFYQDGLIKNKLAQTMSLQVMGKAETGAKVVLWTETRVPVQLWSAQISGTISSVTFPKMLLDVKGGKTYDRYHLVIREENEEQASQQWELEFI